MFKGAKCGDPRSKIYEFEAIDPWTASKFEQLLIFSRISIVDKEIIDEYNGCSFIKFLTTPERRIRTEYIFRRFLNLDRYYFMDLDKYQDNCRKLREDRYMIL